MTDVVKMILSGTGALIALYLLVRYGDGFAKVADSAGSVLINQTKTLQGR